MICALDSPDYPCSPKLILALEANQIEIALPWDKSVLKLQSG
jgi:hypothetical protein